MSAVMNRDPERDPVAIDPGVLDEAAAWLMQLHASTATVADREAWERWRRRSPQHALACELAERLVNKLGALPPAIAMPILARPTAVGRRAALKKLALLLAAVPGGWAAWRATPWDEWTADHRTAVGEQRDIQLADGGRVALNTATAIDVQFDAGQRLVVLRAGEILVQTATDRSGAHRPFMVRTA